MRDKYFKIPIKIYNTTLLVYIGDYNRFVKYIEKYIGESEAEEVIPRYENSRDGLAVAIDSLGTFSLWLKQFTSSPKDTGILNHELLHTVFFIMDRKGIEYDEASEEAFAYLMQYLTEAIYEKIS